MKATLSVKIAPRSMHVAVFGLGYVGTVTAACLARSGHRVIGTDINSAKVRMLRHGQSPVVEPGLSELVREVRSAGRLQATGRHTEAVLASEASLVCVGTPSDHNGGLDLRYVRQVAGHIGDAL